MPQGGKAAMCEDYDSDESSAVPGTLVQAAQNSKRRPAQQRPSPSPLKPVARSESRAPAQPASDSGYSSHASAAQATAAGTKSPAAAARVDPSVRKAVQTPTASSPTKSSKPKPQIHRVDSAHVTKVQTVHSPVSNTGRRCSDPNCVDPKCSSAANTERRFTLPERPHPQQHPSYTSGTTYSTAPYPQYAAAPQMQAPPSSMMPPPAVPRPRTQSMSRARPVSIHGYNSMSYSGSQPGPPPSASAYFAYSQQPYPHQHPQYASAMLPAQHMDYPPPSPVVPSSPSSPLMNTYTGLSGFGGTYSARQANPNVPGLDAPKAMPLAGVGLTRTLSARRPSERPAVQRTSSYIDDPESAESYSESMTDSESDSEYERRLSRRESRRDSRTVVVPNRSSRRPSVGTKYASESVVPRLRRESRPSEITRTRTSQSDKYIDYPSSSDIGDSDRTARAVINRRDARDGREYSERSSRRPSVSSKTSSTRTKPSSLSSVTDYSRVIIEGPNGRHTRYLSKEQQADVIRAYQQQKVEDRRAEEEQIRREKIEAYQKATSGEFYDLTAENVKKHASRKTKTRVSNRSEKSSSSGSKVTNDRGVRIVTGGTVLHVYDGASIEMRPGEDGGPACLVIGSSNGKESSYMGSSKGSSSGRAGRVRGKREVIREEYEPGL